MNTSKTVRRIALAWVVLFALLTSTALASAIDPQSVNGGVSTLNPSGHNVTFSGTSRSAFVEDTLSVYIYLQELHGTTWVTISSASKTLNGVQSVSQTKTTTVSGGYYYRTMSYHESITDGKTNGFYSYSTEKYVP